MLIGPLQDFFGSTIVAQTFQNLREQLVVLKEQNIQHVEVGIFLQTAFQLAKGVFQKLSCLGSLTLMEKCPGELLLYAAQPDSLRENCGVSFHQCGLDEECFAKRDFCFLKPVTTGGLIRSFRILRLHRPNSQEEFGVR